MKRMIGLMAAMILAGCAAPTRYEGVALPVGGLPPRYALHETFRRGAGWDQMDLAPLAALAREGDKQAQLELGIRFEQGRGVAIDRKRARRLYARAATRSGGTIMIYQPPVRKGGNGQVMPVDTGPVREGLPEAKMRLEILDAERVVRGE